MPDALLGPLGLLVGALIAVGFLVRLLVQFIREYIADLKAQRDTAIDGWKAQTTATDRLANATELRNRRDAKDKP